MVDGPFERYVTSLVSDDMGELPRLSRRPELRSQVVARDEIVKRLLGVSRDQVVVVVAPAAYGKTTTIRLWDEADERDFAWIQLDEIDNDDVSLVRHVAAALLRIEALSTRASEVLVGAAEDPRREMIPAVARALEDLDPFVLVIDDVHLLRSERALRALSDLLDQLPQSCQVVLASRQTIPLRLAHLEMAPGVLHLSTDDLAMTDLEARRLCEAAEVVLSAEDLAELMDRTEGWPGAVHLIAVAAARRGDQTISGVFASSREIVADYLIEEVLDVTPPDVVEFLERSSVLEEMSADLVDELLGIADSAERLAEIERMGNLFLVPLDHDRTSYRYHGLFRDVLRERGRTRDSAAAKQLEARAARIRERAGDIDGAIRHLIAAGDPDGAAALVLQHALALVEMGRTSLLEERIGQLPPGMTARSAAAALVQAFLALSTGDVDTGKRAILHAETAPPNAPLGAGSPSVAVVLAVLRGFTGWNGLQAVIDDSQVVRDGGPHSENTWWTVGTIIQGTAFSMLGEVERARDRFLEALSLVADAPVEEAVATAHLAYLSLRDGDLVEAEEYATRAEHLMRRYNLHRVLLTIVVYPVAALVATRAGRFADAADLARRSDEMIGRLGMMSPRSALFSHLLLGEAAIMTGDFTRARECARRADRARRREGTSPFLNAQLRRLHESLESVGVIAPGSVPLITTAELRVLNLLPSHRSLKEIADELFVSRNTVKSHSVAIYRKLGVGSRGEAVARARELGILMDEDRSG